MEGELQETNVKFLAVETEVFIHKNNPALLEIFEQKHEEKYKQVCLEQKTRPSKAVNSLNKLTMRLN